MNKATDVKCTASGQPLDPRGGYLHAGEFLKDVWRAGRDNVISARLDAWQKAVKTAGHMEEGDDSQGGFLVPTDFISELQLLTGLDDGIPGRCTQVPVETSAISIPYVNDTAHTANVYGGIVITRTGEAQRKTASKPTFGKCTLTLHKLTALTYVSDEVMEDSPASIAAMFRLLFPEALNHTVAGDIINGTGAGMGLGIVNAPATILVPRVALGMINWADIVNLWERLYPRGIRNAVWLANSDTFPDLAVMTFAGPLGDAVPVYLPASEESASPYGTLMGRPLILTEHCPSIGNTGDIILADLSQMLLARKGPQVDKSIHLRFDYNETTFRGEVRYDCQPWWPAPVTPTNGLRTVSPLVVLSAAQATTTTTEEQQL